MLDIGCHVGNLIVAAGDLGFDAEGVDVDPVATQAARDMGRNVRTASISDVSGSYDVLVANHVLEHLGDPKDTLRHIARLLNARGRAFVFVPHYRGLLPRLMKDHWSGWFPTQHVWHFEPRTLIRLVEETSLLRVISCTTKGVIEPRSTGARGQMKGAISMLASALNVGDEIQLVVGKIPAGGDI